MKPRTRLCVNRNRRCPICGQDSWCLIARDRSDCICMRVESPRPFHLQTGEPAWYWKLDGKLATPPAEREIERADEINLDVAAILRRWSMDTTPHALAELGVSLGVTADSLRRLGAAWSKRYQAWGFPMYQEADGFWEPVGIRLRNMAGDKWAVRGSHQGLFMPTTQELTDPILILEGPTDTAAMMDLGFAVIGRPSCSGCADLIKTLLTGSHHRDVVICSDTDVPGRRGAAQLALAIGPCKIIQPRIGKDARAWKNQGATRDEVISIVRNTRPSNPLQLRKLIQSLQPPATGKPIAARVPADGSLS